MNKQHGKVALKSYTTFREDFNQFNNQAVQATIQEYATYKEKQSKSREIDSLFNTGFHV
ncbi:hypothetical protein FLA_5655 [Filimonas lacunae]|nr:hypothetical protein FLA_5655 [Filimonas lacunae]